MSKHVKKSSHLQVLESPQSIPIQIPLPMLAALEGLENAFFDLCVEAGRQVLDAMMEQDREALCGPKWRRDPSRKAGRSPDSESWREGSMLEQPITRKEGKRAVAYSRQSP